MKVLKKLLLAFSIVSQLSFATKNRSNCKLNVTVNCMRNNQGILQVVLYNRDGSIPDENFKKYYKMQISQIANHTASVVFENLPPGNYAVSVLHDENVNGKIDKGLFLPKEGIGFSNYQSISLTNRPTFSKSNFNLNSDSSISVKMIYF